MAVCWFGCFSTNAGACLVMPFLSFFIENLGVKNVGQVEQLSGVAFSITFLAGCLMSPLWGKLADSRGRKTVLMYTGLGLTLSDFIFIFTPNVQILIVFRLLQGLVSGYNPAATSLVAKDTPTEKAGWALATLSTGQMAGTLVGPIIGGYLNELMPIRMVYLVTSGFLFISFLVSFFLKENQIEDSLKDAVPVQKTGSIWQYIDAKLVVFSLLLSTCLINTANQSIEPIVSLFVRSLLITAHTAVSHVSFYSGIVVSATGFGILLTASIIGKSRTKPTTSVCSRFPCAARHWFLFQ